MVEKNGESIILDGEEYVKRSFVEEKFVLKTSVSKSDDGKFSEVRMPFLCEVNVMALGSVKLGADFIASKVSIDYLKKAISICEQVSTHKKRESIMICFTKNYPVCLGDINGNLFSGVIIAPRSDSGDDS